MRADGVRGWMLMGIAALGAAALAVEPVGLYDYPRLHVPHTLLRVQLMQAVTSAETQSMRDAIQA